MTAEVVKVEENQVAEVVAPQEESVKVVEGEGKENVETVGVETKLKAIERSASYKEESNFFSDLKESERKALSDLKSKLEEAIVNNNLFTKDEPKKKETTPVKEKAETAEKEKEKTEESKEGEESAETKKEGEEENKKLEEKTEEEKKPEDKTEEEKKPEEKTEEEKKSEEKTEEEEIIDRDISLWGLPLLPSKGSDSTDVILLKFLRARDFKVTEAFEMLKKTLQWRQQNSIDSIKDENFGAELNSAAYMDGVDREGHPVCYNNHGVFENEELYQKTFGTEENRQKFLKWRFQLMEKGIEKLDLKPGGVSSLLQINDLKHSPGLSRKELRVAMKQAIVSLQDNYPEFVARNIFINVPFWFYALNALLSPFLTQRTKSKFVVARPAKVTETLLKYIPAEEVPVQYGGFKRENDFEFSAEEASAVLELIVKAGSTETIEIPANETGTTLVWDITVLGWEVNYKEEFVPSSEGSYTVIVQKGKKMGSKEGPVRNSFRSNEAGKVVLTIENVSGKKKRVVYRFKTKKGSSF